MGSKTTVLHTLQVDMPRETQTQFYTLRVTPETTSAFYRVQSITRTPTSGLGPSVVWQGASLRTAHYEAWAHARALQSVCESKDAPRTVYLRTPALAAMLRKAGC